MFVVVLISDWLNTLSRCLQLWALVCVWTEKLLTDVRTSTQVAKLNRNVERIQEMLIGPKSGLYRAHWGQGVTIQHSSLVITATLDPFLFSPLFILRNLSSTEHRGSVKKQVLK